MKLKLGDKLEGIPHTVPNSTPTKLVTPLSCTVIALLLSDGEFKCLEADWVVVECGDGHNEQRAYDETWLLKNYKLVPKKKKWHTLKGWVDELETRVVNDVGEPRMIYTAVERVVDIKKVFHQFRIDIGLIKDSDE